MKKFKIILILAVRSGTHCLFLPHGAEAELNCHAWTRTDKRSNSTSCFSLPIGDLPSLVAGKRCQDRFSHYHIWLPSFQLSWQNGTEAAFSLSPLLDALPPVFSLLQNKQVLAYLYTRDFSFSAPSLPLSFLTAHLALKNRRNSLDLGGFSS